MADKDVDISVDLKIDNAVKEAHNLNKELNAMFKVTGDKELSSKVMGMTNRIEKQQYTLQKMTAKLQDMGSQQVATEQYKKLEAAAKRYYSMIQEKEANIARWREQGYVGHGRGKLTDEKMDAHIAAAEAKVQQLNNSLAITQSEMQTLVEQGKAFTFSGSEEEINDLTKKMEMLEHGITKNITSMYEQDSALASEVVNAAELEDRENGIANSASLVATKFHEANVAEQQAVESVGKADQNMAQFASRAAVLSRVQGITGSIANGFKRISSASASVGSKIKAFASNLKTVADRVKGVVSRFRLLNKESSSHNLNLKKGLNTLLKYGLGIRSIFILWRKLRAYAQDALKLMAQQFTEIDAVVSDIINSFNQFKNSVGTAVQPLMTALAPALVHVLGLLTKMNEAIAHFFAILTGQKYIYKAKKANDSYAESLKKTGSSAKDAAKDIASYDKLLVINKDTGNGGGSGSGDADEIVDAFQKTLAHSDFAEQLRKAIAAGDWEGVGALFGQKLNILSATFDNWIMTEFQPKAKTWGKNAARIVNGFFDTVDWGGLGTTFGHGLNSILDLVNGFQDNLKALKVGQSLGQFVQSFATTVDWNGVGHMIAQFFNNIADGIQGFTDTVNGFELGTKTVGETINKFIDDIDLDKSTRAVSDLAKEIQQFFIGAVGKVKWFKVGKKISRALGKIDWERLFQNTWRLIGVSVGGVTKFIGGLIAGAFEGIEEYFKEEVEECGGNIALGILKGILKVWFFPQIWFYNNIFKPFVEGLKDAFGINSPAKKMEPYGKYIMQGIINGFLGKFGDLKDAILDIKDYILGKFEDLKNKLGPIGDGIGSIVGTIADKIKGVKTSIFGFTSELEKLDSASLSFGARSTGKTFSSADLNVSAQEMAALLAELRKKKGSSGTVTFHAPKLADGAVIPANNEFLAVLGDQRRGTNIEAPLDTIKQAVAEVIAEMGSASKDEINLNLDGKTIAKVVWDENQKKYKQTGVRFA